MHVGGKRVRRACERGVLQGEPRERSLGEKGLAGVQGSSCLFADSCGETLGRGEICFDRLRHKFSGERGSSTTKKIREEEKRVL